VDLGQWTGVDLFFCISGYVISRAFEPYFDRYIAEGRWWAAAGPSWSVALCLAPVRMALARRHGSCSWAFNRQVTSDFSESLKTLVFLTFSTNLMLPLGTVTPTNTSGHSRWRINSILLFRFFPALVRGHWRWVAFLLLIFLQSIRSGVPVTISQVALGRRVLDALLWGILVYKFSPVRRSIWGLNPKLLRVRIVANLVSVA